MVVGNITNIDYCKASNVQLTIGSDTIAVVNAAKNFEVVIDNHLTFTLHINSIDAKSKPYTQILHL
jgi:hypothetical protein